MIKIFFSILLMLVCTTQGCISDKEPDGPSIKVGEPLPAFSVVMTDGTVVSDITLKGKVPVIVFFNTDCGDCRKELPVIQKLWEIYKDDPKVVVAPIAREESEAKIAAYWKENNLTMPYSPQDNRDVYSLFAPSIIPRIYIANTMGIVTFSSDDSDMPDLDTLITAIQSSL